MMWPVFLMQWLHVLLSIFWFGSILYADVVLIPTLMKLPPNQQRTFAIPLGLRSDRVLLPVSLLVLVLGLLLGTVFGDIQSLTFLFGTAYGLTFFIALLVTAALILWGNLVSGRAVRRLNNIPLDEQMITEGKMSTTYVAQMQRVRLFTLLELLGFFVVFTTMILPHFDL